MVDFSDFEGDEHYTEEDPAPESDGWSLPELGIPSLRVHPINLVDECDRVLLDQYLASVQGPQVLPDPGGYNDQSAFVMAAFRVIGAAYDAVYKAKKGK